MTAIKILELPKAKPLGSRFRFFLLIIVFFCLTAIWSNILTYNIAIVCINSPKHNTTARHFTDGEETLAVAFVAIGTIVATGPVIFLINRYGTRTILGVLGLFSSVATLLIPLTINHSIAAFYVLRVIQGLALACNMPAVGHFIERWTYFKQKGMFVSVLVTYVQLAPAFTNPISGALCSVSGWESIFYFQGGLSIGLFVIYVIAFRNNPEKHPFVGNTEKRKISTGKDSGEKSPIPYWSILKTPSIWAVWVAGFGNFFLLNMLFLYQPTYLSKVVGYNAESTGFTSAVVPIVEGIVKVICGTLSDRLPIRESIKMRLFNTVAFVGSFVVLWVVAFAHIRNGPVNLVLLGSVGAFLGANTGGFFRAAAVLSKQYSAFVTGIISLCVAITMLILPFFVQSVTKQNTQGQWKLVFLVVGAVVLISNIFFVIFVRGDPCWWTEVTEVESSNSKEPNSENAPKEEKEVETK
ncbi:unnamed protein product, partial [Mesorhabditis belari]|uniref:Major facilitator superfamily (MFS) profile domain-containing protein n=1 Tax=Mesorhabditis belari TaxID=2138241 RepID=A0AAF3EV97_9BILA